MMYQFLIFVPVKNAKSFICDWMIEYHFDVSNTKITILYDESF